MTQIRPKQFTDKFLNFKNPYDLLVFYDHKLLNNIYSIYPWQIEILEKFSEDIPIDDCIRLAIVAANGSGKSQYILAPCACWMAVSFDDSLSYITSSSASQLDTQSERFINSLAYKMNDIHRDQLGGLDCWKVIKRHKEFSITNSHIDLFATDEPKKAEGKHPLVPNGEFAVFVDEGKSIEQDIYDAIARCDGATRRLDISSAGGQFGHFYDVVTKPELNWWIRKITAWQCPHKKKKEIDNLILEHGLHDPLIRSMLFSEFTSVDQKVVIMREAIEECLRCWSKNKIKDDKARAGLDLAAGGDEVVLSVWKGTEQIGQETTRFKNTARAVTEIISWMGKYKWTGLKSEDVNADDGGIGRSMLDNLAEKGWNFNRCLNQQRPKDTNRYANRGSESWWNTKQLIEENILKIVDDKMLKSQLSNRYYRHQQPSNKIILESKEEARAHGHPSPDRADAVVLAWTNTTYQDLVGDTVKEPVKNLISMEELEEMLDDQGSLEFIRGKNRVAVTFGHSIDSLLRNEGIKTLNV